MFLKETKKKLSHKIDRSIYIYIDIEGERNSNGNIVWRDSWEGGGERQGVFNRIFRIVNYK